MMSFWKLDYPVLVTRGVETQVGSRIRRIAESRSGRGFRASTKRKPSPERVSSPNIFLLVLSIGNIFNTSRFLTTVLSFSTSLFLKTLVYTTLSTSFILIVGYFVISTYTHAPKYLGYFGIKKYPLVEGKCKEREIKERELGVEFRVQTFYYYWYSSYIRER